jgi:lauroyl/myristoyl acyltransferase
MAVLFLAFRVGETVTPMETVDDPGVQAYFERTRGRAGVRLVGLREARRALIEALRNGIPVGLVGDRDLTGGGIPIPLFGAPAVLPMGPAMLAVESGVPTYALTVRRAGRGHYRGRVIPIDVPTEGTRRERVTLTMTRLAAAFEDLIADAPDQWWAVFFPIWPDLEEAADGSAATETPATTEVPATSEAPTTTEAPATTEPATPAPEATEAAATTGSSGAAA